MTVINAAKTKDALSTLTAGIYQAGTLAMKASVEAARDHAKATTLYQDHHDSDGLRSKTTGQASGLEGSIRADTTYAVYVESGTPPHVIQAKNAKMLRFQVNGTAFFRRRVNHPGTAERPFMEQARAVGEQALEYGLDFYTDYAIQRFNG